MKTIQLILVVETIETVQSDNAYYFWVLKNFFGEYVFGNVQKDLKIQVHYVYLSGKENYKKERVNRDIRTLKSQFAKVGDSYVVYCLDLDDKGRMNQSFIGEVKDYCEKKGYYLSIAYPEIEDVLRVPDKGSKREMVVWFSAHNPAKDSIKRGCFFTPFDRVSSCPGQTNFGCIIQSIVEHALSKKE